MDRDYKYKSFKHFTYFYYYNHHAFGHREANYRKPKFDKSSSNRRVFGNTNSIGRRRSNEGNSGERNNIICYKCINLDI